MSDDIFDMAREAGIEFQRNAEVLGRESISTAGSQSIEKIERFADLVRADEREACACRAGIALLGADRGLANRVDQAIRARGESSIRGNI